MPIGRHKGELIESVIIKHPDFIFWLSEQDSTPGFQWLYDYIQQRIDTFDAKPFVNAKCAGKTEGQPCLQQVSRFALYRKSGIPTFWCDECDPLQLGANESKLAIRTDYYPALFFLDCYACTREQKRTLIRRLADAKGLTGNVTDQKALDFFYPPQGDEPNVKDDRD